MTKALCFCSVCFVLFTALAVNTAVPAPAINEFMPGPGSDWDGDFDSDSRDDEWVEITNTGAAALDLEGYYLLSGADRDPVFGFTGSLAPGGFACVYGSDALLWQSENDAGSIGLSLNNSGDMLWLVSAVPGDTTVIDSIEYTSSQVGAASP